MLVSRCYSLQKGLCDNVKKEVLAQFTLEMTVHHVHNVADIHPIITKAFTYTK